MKKKVIFWTTSIDELLRKDGRIGGIAIQMNYWSKEFIKNGWDVYSLSKSRYGKFNDIHYLRFYNINKIRIILEIIFSFIYLLKIRPNLIITRGADRQLSYLSIYASIFNTKHIHFAASDADFDLKGNKNLKSVDNKLYLMGLRKLKYVVVQNANQELLLRKNHYRKQNILIIPNVWPIYKGNDEVSLKDIDFLWVSNLRELKRPLWFLELAKRNPRYKFVMIGGANDKVLYAQCEQKAKIIQNLDFLGPKNFDEVNEYFTKSRCFVCTSTIEGFPNTFLQAWANNIPVLTTFDPSDRVKVFGLGKFVVEFEEMNAEIDNILGSKYVSMQKSIKTYFKENHNLLARYDELIEFTNS